MKFFRKTDENRIRCGRCGTDFDFNKNKDGCPLCGFSKKEQLIKEEAMACIVPLTNQPISETVMAENSPDNFLTPPPATIPALVGDLITDEETKIWGSWLMFNSFLPGKALMRVIGWKIKSDNKEYISLHSVIAEFLFIVKKHNLYNLKGFPDVPKDNVRFAEILNKPEKNGSVRRLVHHFMKTFVNMGLMSIKTKSLSKRDIWSEKWEKIEVGLTKEGLDFARLSNALFDGEDKNQVLSKVEREWLLSYLKKIDGKGYREYSVLKEVYLLLKSGKNGNKDLWNWFGNNKKFQDYIKNRSERARDDEKIFKQQLTNYSRTFSSSKISLLREMGIVRNKRNDYTLIGEL
jgi:ribosomal protein L37E